MEMEHAEWVIRMVTPMTTGKVYLLKEKQVVEQRNVRSTRRPGHRSTNPDWLFTGIKWSQERPNRIWKVRKALYGSPQAGRRWDPQLKFPPTFAMDKRGKNNMTIYFGAYKRHIFCGSWF
eukprot:g56530.t1